MHYVPGTNNQEISIENNGTDLIILGGSKKSDINILANAIQTAILSSSELSMSAFEIIKVLGRGYFGKVMLCKRIGTNNYYAIKSVAKERLIQEKKLQTIMTEKDALRKANHPFITKIYFSFQSTSKFYLGLEYAPGGDLNKQIEEKGRINIEDVRIYAAEVSIAIQYLHSIGVIYRDIKPENILVAADGHIKLSDFGLTKILENDEVTSTICGTPDYLAPEAIKKQKYDKMIDWWSTGILIYNMLFGKTPFQQSSLVKLYEAIVTEEPSFPQDADPDAVDLIKKLLAKDPAERIGYSEISNHQFFKDIPFEDVLEKQISPSFIPMVDENGTQIDDHSFGFEECPADSFAEPVDFPNAEIPGFSYICTHISSSSDD